MSPLTALVDGGGLEVMLKTPSIGWMARDTRWMSARRGTCWP